jgi:4-amino-4-deoxy-L-arabinose transferase-like glycosyltransferase
MGRSTNGRDQEYHPSCDAGCSEGPAFRSAALQAANLPWPALYSLVFAAVALSHLTLLRLPYFWDEGGYYIPAALDFYHHGWLVPHFTNAHPPLPNVLLGTLWHLTGFHILATRLLVCAFAAAGLLAVFRLSQRLLDPAAAATVTLLTAVYPIWFAQSTLAHADIFAAAFTLWALALYLPASSRTPDSQDNRVPQVSLLRPGLTATAPGLRIRVPQVSLLRPGTYHQPLSIAALFSLAALSKETAIVWPATLAAIELTHLLRHRHNPTLRREHLSLFAAVAFPVLPLAAWYAYHHHVTGFTFGNPEYLRYNATANLTAAHLWQAVRYRFLHLFWQRNIWLPVLFALACLFLPRRTNPSIDSQDAIILSKSPESTEAPQQPDPLSLIPDPCRAAALPPTTLRTLALLIAANWLFFSVLGGALLTRYLLPVYPLVLLVCVDTWRSRTRLWTAFAAATAAAFLSALWINPPTSFAPEDTLTYRDMIVVHQEAIDYVAAHFPNATVLTAWPVAADLFRPELGYVTRPIKAFSIEDFTRPEIEKAAQEPGEYDTAIVFTTHYTTPSFRHWLLAHPNSRRGQEFNRTRDLTPAEIALLLGGKVVWQDDRNGEWAAVLRFPRSYEARLVPGARLQVLGRL